jgi:tRNA nucleotidyltransferase (CCA-adding enzyme)
VRYAERLNFKLEPQTESLIARDKSFIAALSGERVRHELELILQDTLEPEKSILRLSALSVLTEVHPELSPDTDLPRRFGTARDPQSPPAPASYRFDLWFAPLSPTTITEIVERLKFPTRAADEIKQVNEIYATLPRLSSEQLLSEIHRQLHTFNRDWLLIAPHLTTNDLLRQKLTDYLQRLWSFKLSTNGDTIKALGLPPGPKYKEILFRLECAWLDGEVNTPEEERALLEQLMEEAK